MAENIEQSKSRSWIWWVVVGIVVLWVLAGLWTWFGLAFKLGFTDWQDIGAFGDSFGPINALFSGLALGGIK